MTDPDFLRAIKEAEEYLELANYFRGLTFQNVMINVLKYMIYLGQKYSIFYA